MEVPYNTTIYKEMKAEGKLVAPVADWMTKRRWVKEAFAALEAVGYTVGSGYTAVLNPQRTKIVPAMPLNPPPVEARDANKTRLMFERTLERAAQSDSFSSERSSEFSERRIDDRPERDARGGSDQSSDFLFDLMLSSFLMMFPKAKGFFMIMLVLFCLLPRSSTIQLETLLVKS